MKHCRNSGYELGIVVMGIIIYSVGKNLSRAVEF